MTTEATQTRHDPRTLGANIGTMLCFHKRYTLGDQNTGLTMQDAQRIERTLTYKGKRCLVLPIYMLDHSGLAVNTTGFSDPWDSGRLGIIFATRARLAQALGVRILSGDRLRRASELLIAEVSAYNEYLGG